jgi:hypothetical protein
MLSLVEQRRRRVNLRENKQQQKDIGPWVNPGRQEEQLDTLHAPPTVQQIQVMHRRARIMECLATHQYDEATAEYPHLIELDPAQVLGRQQQFDLANQLMARGKHQVAARAYELFLTAYRNDAEKNQVELMLALIYTRYVPRPGRAREILQTIMPRISDQEQLALAQVLQTELAVNDGRE